MKRILFFLSSLISTLVVAQDYTSYFTGDTADVTTNHQYGVCMMGGAAEDDNAMIWFLERADGGDVLVLRASGSDGYNDYFYSELGVTINSVETIVINNAAGAINPYVLQQVADAEAIWFAGGDQYDYVSYFKDTDMEVALNFFINSKRGVIGGTSAGMATLGGHYFDAANGTVTSAEALANPFDPKVSLGHQDFLDIPNLQGVITDTHYDDPDRRGRHTAFIARISALDTSVRGLGIACEEYSAVCIDDMGNASVYGDYPNSNDYVYFIQENCDFSLPETLAPNTPLTWVHTNDALSVLKIPATPTGEVVMTLNEQDWFSNSVATEYWEHWTVDAGNFMVGNGEDPLCIVLETEGSGLENVLVYPNPFSETLTISTSEVLNLEIHDLLGNLMFTKEGYRETAISVEHLPQGIYFLRLTKGGRSEIVKLVKK